MIVNLPIVSLWLAEWTIRSCGGRVSETDRVIRPGHKPVWI